MQNQKEKGKKAELLVASHYQNLGRTLLHHGWTIPGGELDLVLQKGEELRFVEVKCVDAIHDIDQYVSRKKISTLERTIEQYLDREGGKGEYSLDVAFVQDEEIIELYENVSNN